MIVDNKEIIGVIGITNTISLCVLELDEVGERIKTQFRSDRWLGNAGWCKIKYDRDGNAYFNKNNTKFNLGEIMRA